MIDKKYLITSGCSFTEGHKVGPNASWAKYLAENNNLELINIAKGGVGNEVITQNVISYATLNPEIAKDSLFVIQLSECLRFLICWDSFDEKSNGSIYWHLTPLQFLDRRGSRKITAEGFEGWDLEFPLNKWIYNNRYNIAQLYTNVTFSLIKTYHNIINFTNFCKANDYKFLIFDGINNHIPILNERNGQWFLKDSHGNPRYELAVSDEISDDIDFFHNTHHPFIHKKIINTIKENPNYYKGYTLNEFINSNNEYHKGNDNHPNELGSKLWAEQHLQPIIEELFGKFK
jgi:hypothetical protein